MTGNENIDTDISEVYHALSASRRRLVIQQLSESDEGTLSLRELARNIAAIEEGVPVDRATGEPYRNAYNALSQTHLPTLSEADIIIYDSDRQVITSGPNLDVAALLIVLNHATYRTLRGNAIPDSEDSDTSTTD